MAKYAFPGVWTQRVERPQPPREISPSAMAVIGYTVKGPVNVATRVESWNEFSDTFGGLTDDSMVPITVFEFFENGGQVVYVVRVVPSGSLTATVDVDSPAKWTIDHLYAGAYGNEIVVDIAGNTNYLDMTTYAWDRFDIYVMEPDEDGNLVASEFFEAVQFTDSSDPSYITRVLSDPERGSSLVSFTIGIGGDPDDLTSTVVTDEVVGSGTGSLADFTHTMASVPVLENTVEIVAADTQIDDEAQTPTPAIDGIVTTFTFTLPNAPALDGSLMLFDQDSQIWDENPVPDTGTIDGIETDFTFNALTIANPIHRENTVFQLKYAKTAASSPETIGTIGGVPATFDLSTASGPTDVPVHPGTLDIAVTISAATENITDTPAGDGTGTLSGTGGSLPSGGTIVYATGAMTGTTATLDASSTVDATYNQSALVTKATSTDNLAQGVVLAGAGTGTVNLVDSVTTPTGSGELDVSATVAPLSGTLFYLDYVVLGIVESDVDGDLTGDVGVGTNTVDFSDGAVDVTFANAPLAGSTIDADYYTGQVITDDGVGGLIGDVDPTGTNTINYETGAVDLTFAAAPPSGTDVFGNYVKLEDRVSFALAGGSDGTGVILRAQVSDPALEASGEGMYALKSVEDMFQLAIPDFAGVVDVSRDQLTFAESIKRAFAVLATPEDLTAAEAKQWRFNSLGVYTKWGAVYYPWIYVRNQATDLAELYPPIGTVCGIMARTDNARNVGKSPAGTEDGIILGAVGPEYILGDADLELIYDSGMNALRSSEATGFVVWGARTLERDNPDWQFINAQRLFTYLEFAANRISQFLVFGNNGPALWKRAELSLSGWMNSLFNEGFFAGQTPEQAFYVICDSSNNNQATIEEGIVYIDIGAAPFRPNEFVVIRIAQKVREQV